MKVPKQNPNPLSSCYYRKKPGLWEKDCHKKTVSASSAFSPLTSLSNALLTPNNGAPRNHRGSSQPSLFISSEKQLSRLGMNFFWHQSHTLSSTAVKQPLPRSMKVIQIVGVSEEPQQGPVSEPVPFRLGP